MKETVLITGGAGFIGSHLADKLIEQGYNVKILDALKKPVHMKGKPDYLNPKVDFIFGDVTDRKALEYSLNKVDYVFHFAAYQDYLPDFSSFFYNNSYSTALLYEIINEKNLKIKKIVVASSQFVQGEGLYLGPDEEKVAVPIRSEDNLKKSFWDYKDKNGNKLQWLWTPETFSNPTNSYAISKLSQEQISINLGLRYGVPSVAMRFSIVQGARQSFYNAYSGACRIFSLSYYTGKAPAIYEDGNQLRDFINVEDVVEANLLVLRNPSADYQAFNVGGGKPYSIKEFDRIAARIYGCSDIEPNIPGEYRFGDTRNACSSIEKLKNLGWKPKGTVEKSLLEYKEYLEKQKDLDYIIEFARKQMKEMNVIRKAES